MTTKELMMAWAVNQTGKPYRWGSNGPDSWDCSGLAQSFYAIIGIDPPGDQTAQGYYNYWSRQIGMNCFDIAKAVIGFGDMLYFGKDFQNVSHIAIAMSRHIMFEAGGGGSDCKTIEDARRLGASVRFRPIRSRKDYLCAIRPYHFTESIMQI